MDLRGLLQQIREDASTHGSKSRPGFHAIAVHRLGVWSKQQQRPVRLVAHKAYRFLNTYLVRNLYGIEIYETTVVGRRVHLPHHTGVILGRWAVIGDDCLIRQNVTLGKAVAEDPHDAHPTLGRGVELGAGATVMGAITVGDGARIGPHAVVLRDVPAGATAFAPMTKVMRTAAPD